MVKHTTDSMDMSVNNSRRWWRTGQPGMLQSTDSQTLTWLSDWTTTLRRVGSKSSVLHVPPAHSTTKGVGKPPTPPLPLIPEPAPALTAHREPASPWLGEQAREPITFFTPSHCYRDPSKALLEFLIWSLINFYWLRRPRTLVSNIGVSIGGGLRLSNIS